MGRNVSMCCMCSPPQELVALPVAYWGQSLQQRRVPKVVLLRLSVRESDHPE